MKIHCKYDKLVDPMQLQDHPKNRNQHGQDQIDRLSELYQFHGVRHSIIVSTRSNCIVAGHGRKLAAIRAGMKGFPVVYQDFDTEEAEYAFLISDNAISDWSELDHLQIHKDILALGADFDIKMLGLTKIELDSGLKSEENLYTDKIETPIYEISGKKPVITELYDLTKYKELCKDIKNAADIPEEDKEFLMFAASRHIVFNYEKIANYYAHSEKTAQGLFENSALVIIDFDKAVENGFVKLSKEMNESYIGNDEYEDDED